MNLGQWIIKENASLEETKSRMKKKPTKGFLLFPKSGENKFYSKKENGAFAATKSIKSQLGGRGWVETGTSSKLNNGVVLGIAKETI